MDASVVVASGPAGEPELRVVENRNLRRGDLVVLGRSEDGGEGVYVHAYGLDDLDAPEGADKFAFRQGRSRETAFASDYDRFYDLLRHEREHGAWCGSWAWSSPSTPKRRAMQLMVEGGYVDAVMAGNALATHDLEAATLHTALGQDVYTQRARPLGHYNHLDVINRVRRAGSIEAFVREEGIEDGIVASCVRRGVPMVLAGSIRDDGPLPGVIGDAYEAQGAMRALLEGATTVICLATMLHTIATGNMTPSYAVTGDGTVCPVYFYAVDVSEFVVKMGLWRILNAPCAAAR